MIKKRINEVSSVYPRGNKIYIEFFDNNGKLKKKSTGKKFTPENMEIVRNTMPKFEAQLKDKSLLKIQPKSIGMYSDSFIAIKKKNAKIQTITSRINKLIEYVGYETLPSEITVLNIREFFASMNVSRATKQSWLVHIRGLFQLVSEDNATPTNLLQNFQLEKEDKVVNGVEVKPFNKDEVELLISSAEGMLRNYLGIAFNTGMRIQEIIGLKISDIDFKHSIINIERAITKNREKSTKTVSSDRQIPLFETARDFFSNQIEYATSKKSEYLFCKEDGSSLNDSVDIRGNRTYGNIRKSDGGRVISTTKGSWYELLENLGFEYRKMKNTRHTFAATALSSNMMSMQEVASILGHTSLRMIVNVYARYLGKSHIGLNRSIDIFNNISTTTSTTSCAS
ncbi:tyrosine-type recombinase/integrase [Sulfurimonas sp. CS5]|jgi:integrase|uniref:tyrosine-type recombinase/integrase n=1 Tax=Sulfurimonas sp. CS5 TaxID=3391145 RepID=UPI0039E9E2C5